jgi:hypothetical protein
VLQTAEEVKNIGKLLSKVGGLIVCTKYPSYDTNIMKAKIEFRKKYKGPLIAKSSQREFEIKSILNGTTT